MRCKNNSNLSFSLLCLFIEQGRHFKLWMATWKAGVRRDRSSWQAYKERMLVNLHMSLLVGGNITTNF